MKIIYFFFILIFYFSCQKSTEIKIVPAEVVQPTIKSGPDVEVNIGGTDSAGGGNGAEGRPLDSFIESDFLNLAAVKNKVLPIILKLSLINDKVAADFFHISLNRDWYFVPVRLDMISKQIIGSYGVTDQLALQDLNKIWVNSKYFKKMNIDDQGILIIHEIIMGMRLMQYQHRQDQCLAEASLFLLNNQKDQYKKSKSSCLSTYPKLIGSISSKFSLNSDDYDLIRKIVSLIITEDKSKLEEAVLLIQSTKLREYK